MLTMIRLRAYTLSLIFYQRRIIFRFTESLRHNRRTVTLALG
jgi:hypothetical protein